MHTLGNLLQKSGSNLVIGGVLGEVDWDEELLSLLVNITNIDTTFVGEKDPIALKWNSQPGIRIMIGWQQWVNPSHLKSRDVRILKDFKTRR